MTDAIMNTYGRFPLVLARGEGCYVYDDNGNKYLDFVAGIAVNSLGHGHPRLAGAIADQAKQLIHVSNYYWNKPQMDLAEKLVANSGMDKVFFCNSGAEAVEGCLKLARKYARKKNSEAYEIIAMNNSFHGRTFGAITATGQQKYRKGLDPLLPGIVHVDFNDYDALAQAVTEKTCAILLEPIQSEGGIYPADREYLQKVRKLCDDRDIILIFDEVQCGAGRTGRLFAYEHYVCPDVMALAKGLAGGVPIGAILAKDKFAEAFSPGDHASTFGGNPLATAAANVVVDELLGGLLDNVKKSSAHLEKGLHDIGKQSSRVKDVRGLGLLMGMELDAPVKPLINSCMERGLLLVNAGDNVIRFVPPLIVKTEEIDEALEILKAVLLS